MIIKRCNNCKKEFITYQSKNGKYCSRQCTGIARRIKPKQLIKICGYCKKEFKFSTRLHLSEKQWIERKYCSLKCAGQINRVGIEPSNKLQFGTRTKMKNGYIQLTTERGNVFEHRIVVENYIGRYLRPTEIIHHINLDKTDNRLENLFIFPNNATHTGFHSLLRHGWIQNITKSNLNEYKLEVY